MLFHSNKDVDFIARDADKSAADRLKSRLNVFLIYLSLDHESF